jgi:hypothetical protein
MANMRHFWKHRRWLLLALVLAALLLVALPFSQPRRPVPINQTDFDLVFEGMSKTEVEELLGGPPGDYTNGSCFALDIYGGGVLMKKGLMMEWRGDRGIIQIGFDKNNNVLWKRFVEVGTIRKPHLFERLLALLGL